MNLQLFIAWLVYIRNINDPPEEYEEEENKNSFTVTY